MILLVILEYLSLAPYLPHLSIHLLSALRRPALLIAVVPMEIYVGSKSVWKLEGGRDTAVTRSDTRQ